MSTTRKALCALALSLAATAAGAASANDSGPARDVRAVRSAAQTLLPGKRIESVAAADGVALAQWSGPQGTGIDGFAYIWDRWWDMLQVRSAAGGAACIMGSAPFAPGAAPVRHGLSAQDLTAAGVPPALAAAALSTFAPSTGLAPGEGCRPAPPAAPGAAEVASPPWQSEGYAVRIVWGRRTGSFVSAAVAARRPTKAESWTYYPGGNAYAFFHVDSAAEDAVDVAAGTTVDVTFPFALDARTAYSLTIAQARAPIGPIAGTLAGNTLHFELPAFTVPANAELMAEIDGSL